MIAEMKEYATIVALLTQHLVQCVIAVGSKSWNRSKVMLVGEGRVGKTALCNSMMGRPFVETTSTVGLTQLTCDVRRGVATSGGRWSLRRQPEREYEHGVAQLIRSLDAIKLAENDLSVRTSEISRATGSFSSINDLISPLAYQNSALKFTSQLTVDVAEHTLRSDVTDFPEVTEYAVHERASIEPNVDLVMKCLADVTVHDDEELILSLIDFGGQSVFNVIHHLFLTSYGVYLVLFNMVDTLNGKKREQSLHELSFWINAIVMHTSSTGTNRMAPIFLVGTHKDVINNPIQHKKISSIIEKRFEFHVGWPNIQDNGELCFYPVNNRINRQSCIRSLVSYFYKTSQQDEVVLNLFTNIKNVLKEADYVKEHRPLTWLRALDEFVATEKSFLTMTEALSIARANGVERQAVQNFLSFLNEMGVVLWINEKGMRDVVILNIITFFVEPATLIICNHILNPSNNTIHHKNIQEVCKKERSKEWKEMTQRGLVSRQLMEFLLLQKVDADNIPVIINMMLKYGLVVKLEQSRNHSSQIDYLTESSPTEYYLVPALLPKTACNPCVFQDHVWRHIKPETFDTCYFVFSVNSKLNSTSIGLSQLRSECFLPRGLMERLIGKVVKWSQLTHIADINDVKYLYRNYAVLSYGRQRFRLVYIPEINCIRLDIEGMHPLPVYNRIHEQVTTCVRECMGSLQFVTALQFGDSSESEDGFRLLKLEAVREVYEDYSTITIKGLAPVDRRVVKHRYSSWLNNSDILRSYDVFISHRWHQEDDEISDQLYDAFLGCTVGSERRAIQVFYDKVRIKKCQMFRTAFGKALVNSTILVPIVRKTALDRMFTHNPKEEDNLLIEWILAQECMKDPKHSKMRGIYPIMFGERNTDGSVGNLFDEGVIDELPETVPTASIASARSLLIELGINVSPSLDNITVRGVVKGLKSFYGMLCWEVPTNTYTYHATEAIVEHLEGEMEAVNDSKIERPVEIIMNVQSLCVL